MAIGSSAITNQAKLSFFSAEHRFDDTPAARYKIALYPNSATIDNTTGTYTASGEVAGTGYTAGGKDLPVASISAAGTTVFIDFTDVEWTSASFTARGGLIYNTASGNKTVAVINFGGDYTVSSGTFRIVWPTPDTSNAIIRLS